jgi:endoglucanase Acf2
MKIFNFTAACERSFIALLTLACLSTLSCPQASAQAESIALGKGKYFTQPRGSDKAPPSGPNRSGMMLERAVPTNQWYSSLVFKAESEALFAHPLSVKPTARGFELAYPQKQIVPTPRLDVEVHYPHANPLVFRPTHFKTSRATLDKASDWAIDIASGDEGKLLKATVAHGSPLVSFTLTEGNVDLFLPAEASSKVGTDSRVLRVNYSGQSFAVFGPTGAQWSALSAGQWRLELPEGKKYFSALVLPDASDATLAELSPHAYVFIKDTRVAWQYDEQSSKVTTSFKAMTQTMEGSESRPLLGLYPHHWHRNDALMAQTSKALPSIRGMIRLLPAAEFQTEKKFTGLLPYWPGVDAKDKKALLDEVMSADLRQARSMLLPMGEGPYWQGKGLQRLTQMMAVFEQQGNIAGRDRLLELVKGRMAQWLSGDSRKTYFHYDRNLGTVVSYPEEYFSVQQMNDHHFHYGYWIRAAAEVAMRDPQWAQPNEWGGMIDLLIKDIATPERGRRDFPFLRNFDAYESHSWASGVGLGPDGNNQESSSEAINAWVGLILWGELKGDRALRDLGVWLYTSEIEAIQHYWFDLYKLVFPKEYKNVEVSMLFGGKYAHNTWWTDEPRQIHGINLLPITTASLYLGRDPAFILRNLEAMDKESEIFKSRGKRADPPDIWGDIFLKYRALAQPQEALAQWQRWGSVEFGETRTHTLHWLLTLSERGTPVLDVTADTPFYGVFKNASGQTTYWAYNFSNQPRRIQFSDGQQLMAEPRRLSELKK